MQKTAAIIYIKVRRYLNRHTMYVLKIGGVYHVRNEIKIVPMYAMS